MDMFFARKITDTMTCITDLAGCSCFLAEGTDSAVLIDSGVGLGDIRTFVSGLTDKEISVVLTHGHADHLGGASRFNDIYINKEDYELAIENDTKERKYYQVSINNPLLLSSIKEEDMCPSAGGRFQTFDDGQRFDLDRTALEMIHIKGHTKGYTMVLNTKDRVILFGDGCNNNVFLCGDEATDVETYRDSLLELKKHESLFDRCLVSHGQIFIDKDILSNTIKVCDEILLGRSDEIPYPYYDNRTYYIAHKTGDGLVRQDHGEGNIIYDINKVLKQPVK